MENQPRYRSFFWPILLVGVGVILLLRNLGLVPALSLGTILKLWPLILIVIGLDILFGRRVPWMGTIISLLAVGGVVAYLLLGPKVGLDTGPVTKTETFSTPAAGVKTVEYNFNTSSSPVDIQVMEGSSSDLISAVITHRGIVNFDVSGLQNTTVSLSETTDSSEGWIYWDFSFDDYQWDVSLAPEVPTSILLSGGSGSISMDLRGVNLTSLRTDFGSGSSEITLPESGEPYVVEIESGSGSVHLNMPENTSLTLTLDGGSGSNNVNIPSEAALRVEVSDDGSGSLSLPDGLVKASDSDDFSVGAWQTEGYEDAENQVLIQILSQGSGSITIH